MNYDTDYDYASAGTGIMSDERCWAVAITHYHPAFLRHGSVDPILVKLYYLVWARTLLLLDCCLQLLHIAPGPMPGTREFAEKLIDFTRQKEANVDLENKLIETRQQVIELQRWNAIGKYIYI